MRLVYDRDIFLLVNAAHEWLLEHGDNPNAAEVRAALVNVAGTFDGDKE